jgi:arylsulfatase A-like enzyme
MLLAKLHSRRTCLVLALLLFVGCSPTSEEGAIPEVAGPPFDVLIVALDACRADRIGAYGYDRPTTPHLDALVTEPDAVLFDRYFVEGNWTKSSTASLFTGLYVHQHGVVSGHNLKNGNTFTTQLLSDDHVTLGEQMRDLGFTTFGVVKSEHLVDKYGFAQGFDFYKGPKGSGGDEGRVRETSRLVESLEQAFFGYVHLNACHHPYPERTRHAEFMEVFGGGYPEKERIAAGVDFTGPEVKHAILRDELELEPADKAYLSVLYDAQLRRVDEVMVAPILTSLKRSGRWDRTLLIVTADHGESLNEHGGYAHGGSLWNEVIHVPLIVKFPAGQRPAALPDRVAAAGSNVDLYPSILSFLDHPVPEWLPGRSLFDDPDPGFVFSQGGNEWAVIQGEDKLYVADGTPRLFDLAADPGERRDLAASNPDRVGELFQLAQQVRALEASDAGTAVEIETTLSEEARENLRALGYLE